MWFTPIQHLFYITPPRLIRLIPSPYREQIPQSVIRLFDNELRKHIDDLLDLRGVTFMNKGFPRMEFPLTDEQVKSMFRDYPKHNYDFYSKDIDVLRNQNFNLANFAGISWKLFEDEFIERNYNSSV